MKMTPEEICREYRQAKNPEKQIDILADLNQCTPEAITAVLREAGELKEAAIKKDKVEIEKHLIELYAQRYSNEEIAEKMGLTKRQITTRLTWLKKKGRLLDDNLALAESEPAKTVSLAADENITRIISLLSELTSIPQTQVLSLSMRFTDDGSKNWRLDLHNESGKKEV